ncbi:hypothetical protein RQP46_009198 [Phenoliferia psychrophenolica]
MQQYNLDQIEHKLELHGAIDVFYNVKKNDYFYAGRYQKAYRGQTYHGELVGLLGRDARTVKEWRRIDKSRPGWGANDETGLVRGQRSISDQLNTDPSITLDFLLLECVGFDMEGLGEWVDKRTRRP